MDDYSQVDIPELNVWEALQGKLHQTLIHQGAVSTSLFSASNVDTRLLFKQYVHEHPHIDLEYQESANSLQLSPHIAPIVRKIWSLLEPVVLDIQNRSQTINHDRLADSLKEFFVSFSSYTAINVRYTQLSQDFVTLFVDTETIFENIQVPNPMLTLVSPHYEVSHETLESLRHFLTNTKKPTVTRIVILLLFCKFSDLDTSKRLFKTFGAKYGCNIIVIHHEDLMEVVAAKEPTQALRRLILSQVGLSALHPYMLEGPTPPLLLLWARNSLA